MTLRISILAIFMGIVSCEKDISDKFRDTQQNVFVLSGELSAFEHPTINLTRSITMTQLDTLLYLNNAEVEIRWGDEILQLEPIGSGNYTTDEFLLQPGEEYHIHCRGEDLPDASAVLTIPAEPVVTRISCTVDDSLKTSLEISIDDPLEVEDYYSFYISGWLRELHVHHDENGIETRDTLNVFTNYRIPNLDSLFEYAGDYRNFHVIEEGLMYVSNAHFTDRHFNGTTLKLSIQDHLWRYYNDSIPEINIHLIKRDIHYFNYLESMIRYDPYNDLPIIQPVQIYSNIVGGFGLLTAKTHYTHTIDMSQWYNDPKLTY